MPGWLRASSLKHLHKPFGVRNTSTNTLYVSIISALLAVLALTKQGAALQQIDNLLYIAISFVAIVLCWTWRGSMKAFDSHFKTKFDVLRDMEKQLPYKIYAMEEKLRTPSRHLIKEDELTPVLLIAAFSVILLYGAYALVFSLH
jgi:hypothetical protein